MTVKWSETARDDLRAIHDYIARNSVFYADKFIDKLIKAAEKLEIFPRMGRVVPEIDSPFVREISHGSYRIMYLLEDDCIYITQVIHGARDFRP